MARVRHLYVITRLFSLPCCLEVRRGRLPPLRVWTRVVSYLWPGSDAVGLTLHRKRLHMLVRCDISVCVQRGIVQTSQAPLLYQPR